MLNKRLCDVYKSSRQDEMYLFVDKTEQLQRVPAPLLEKLGEVQLVTTLLLTATKKLARADAATILSAIEDQGFYLQLPPSNPLLKTSMDSIAAKNEKLPR